VGFIDSHILSFMTFLPLLGQGDPLRAEGEGRDDQVDRRPRLVPPAAAVGAPLVTYDRSLAGVNVASQFQFVEHYSWIPSINVEYFVGADGISMPMLLLTALLSFLAVIGSWGSTRRSGGTWPSSSSSRPA